MTFTTVGTFDVKDLDVIKTVCAVTKSTIFNKKEVISLERVYITLECSKISYKVLFNEHNLPIKIIFRKVKTVV